VTSCLWIKYVNSLFTESIYSCFQICKIIKKTYQDFPELWSQMYCHLFMVHSVNCQKHNSIVNFIVLLLNFNSVGCGCWCILNLDFCRKYTHILRWSFVTTVDDQVSWLRCCDFRIDRTNCMHTVTSIHKLISEFA